ncbi:MAG: carboxypeptidase regulatory-like domain-containing protein [Planctomycetota bacterium]
MIGLLLLAVLGAVGFWWMRSDDLVMPSPSPVGDAPVGTVPVDGAPVARGDAAAGLPAGVVATRTQVEVIEPTGMAPAPTACLKVIDHETGEPLAGAAIRLVQNGADVAFTDENGLAPIALEKAAQLAVVTDTYLLRLAPTQLGSTEADPQIVRLVPDSMSIRRRFVLVPPAGVALGEAFARLRPENPTADASPAQAPSDPVRKRAWQEHTMLAPREVARDVLVQLGRFDERRVLRLAEETDVRFLVPGDYVLEVATTTGLVGRATVRVAVGPLPPPQRVELAPGVMLRGRVTDEALTPLAGAELTIQGGEPLGLVAKSAADGTFALAPLLPGPVTVLARRAGHEAAAVGPVNAGASDVAIALTRLDQTLLRGRVRARPGLEPIAGATVLWQVANGDSARTTSGADGTFELGVTGELAARLVVQADGFVTCAELVEPTAGFADYDLWPAERAVRLDKGLTGTLEGIVLGDGGPAANVSVRWTPAQATPPAVAPGRRTLEGATLPLTLVTTTGDDGAFVLETDQFGPGRLTLVTDEQQGIDVTVIAGRAQTGLELHR